MSTRDCSFSISAIEPLIGAIRSFDDSLLEPLRAAVIEDALGDPSDYSSASEREAERAERLDDYDDRYGEAIADILLSPKPPKLEAGVFEGTLFAFAEVLGLDPDRNHLAINEGYKHYYLWDSYIHAMEPLLSSEAIASLDHLNNGRPFRGQAVEHDGCMFAWLSSDEIATLARELAAASPDTDRLQSADLDEWHEDFVASLTEIAAKGRAFVLTAC